MSAHESSRPRFLPGFLTSLLIVSLLSFAVDFFHMVYHVFEEPALLKISGVPLKLAAKSICLLIPALLLICRASWIGFILMMLASPVAFARPTECQHARELLDKSGVARDADENLFGKINVKPPHGSFPPDMDKITWWGAFKPFEFWESPEFQAVWINPQGEEVARKTFRGNKCRLAGNSVHGEAQPRGEFQGGMWNVIVTCEDYLIDKQTFAVVPASGVAKPGPDSPGRPQETAMIWAKAALDE